MAENILIDCFEKKQVSIVDAITLSRMTEKQNEHIAVNGNAISFDHDEYQYLKLIKNIIETGLFIHSLL